MKWLLGRGILEGAGREADLKCVVDLRLEKDGQSAIGSTASVIYIVCLWPQSKARKENLREPLQ